MKYMHSINRLMSMRPCKQMVLISTVKILGLLNKLLCGIWSGVMTLPPDTCYFFTNMVSSPKTLTYAYSSALPGQHLLSPLLLWWHLNRCFLHLTAVKDIQTRKESTISSTLATWRTFWVDPLLTMTMMPSQHTKATMRKNCYFPQSSRYWILW